MMPHLPMRMVIQHLGHGRIFHERYEYIRTPTEPQKITGASTIPATIILVTAKTPQTPTRRKIYDSGRSFGIGMKSGTGRTLV
ncbi:hypothetical protein ELH84_11075 [Rhizobium ruizarguesonis]|nr:hypothetical protein ELH84_11075 [Rhizobium ruizarguesonis]